METPDFFEQELDLELFDQDPEEGPPPDRPPSRPRPPVARSTPALQQGTGFWASGERIGWIAGLILALSTFMDWYAGKSAEGPTLAVIGWHTGALGKLVFFTGLIVVALAILREFGVQLPATVPESLVVIALGSLATIFVLIRLISIPDTFVGTSGRGIGIWISLLAGLAVIAAGLLQAAEEL